jgi:AraC-like DNA-binding protein/ActR/RegA family two-component response regulator
MSSPVVPVILVADDDPAIHDTLHLVFDDEYCVLDAYDGLQTLELSRYNHVDLILLDILMPGLDGISVLEHLSSADTQQRVILLTGLYSAWPAVTGMRLGALDCVTKPFDPDDLLSLVNDTLTKTLSRTPPLSGRSPLPIGGPARLIKLIGVDLGVHASLAVLLAASCQIEPTAMPASLRPEDLPSPGGLIIVDLSNQESRDVYARLARMTDLPYVLIAINLDEGNPAGAAGGTHLHTALPKPTHLSRLLREITEHTPLANAGQAPYRANWAVRQTLDAVSRDYPTTSVGALARSVGISTDYLSRVFRVEIGIPLRRYLTRVRLEAARQLLLESNLKLETIAARVGLEDASYFSRLFLRYCGRRPGSYRTARQ